MRVTDVGDGEPGVAVVGAVHGDEPCGARAIERFLNEDWSVDQPVRLIVANERALAQNRRYIDVDLNRVLPGDPDSPEYERRLAAEFTDAVEGMTCLGIHSTVSYDRPFGALAAPTPLKAELFDAIPDVTAVMDATGLAENRCVNQPRFIDVEAGEQWTDRAAEQAYEVMLDFMRATGVLDEPVTETRTSLYRVFDVVTKDPGYEYTFVKENFERVEAGEVFAFRDDEPMRADRDFYPVLFSADGHETLLGYRTERFERIHDAIPG